MKKINHPAIQRLTEGATVITATARLARELQTQFDQHQLADKKSAWESADVLPYQACLRRFWQDLNAQRPDCPLLLDALQLAAAWENIIRDDINRRDHDDAPLWNPHASAKTAVDAWRILNAWNIDLEQCAQSIHEDHRRWLRWARQFEQLCADKNWTDPHRLANELIVIFDTENAQPQLPRTIEFAGFDRILPQQQSLINALQKCGVAIVVDAQQQPSASTIELRDYENETQQWLSAARWARKKLLSHPQSKLAIIAPDLNNTIPAIEYALQQILCPQQLIEPVLNARLPYHVSLGKKLSRHPVAKDALAVLTPMTGGAMDAESISQLIRSPFIRGGDSEAVARAKLEQRCRQRLPWQMRLRQLVKEFSDDHNFAANACPSLQQTLRAALPLLDGIGKARSVSHWARHFGEWLDALGWPGERSLDSDEYQAARAFRRQLKNLARLDLTSAPMNAAAALGWLRRRVDEQPFQVEAHDAPVQVLGVVEAAGQRFDGIWFGGLVEANWPAAQSPNPFIAVGLQRECGVIGASVEHNREHAAWLQRRLIASTDEIILSRPRTVDEIPAQPSALLMEFGDRNDADTERPTEVSNLDMPLHLIHQHRPELQAFTDPRAPAHAAHAIAKGGTSLIENQAKCPFRAFAIHRLGAREVEPNEQGLDAGERGSLIHHALQVAWQAIGSSEKLRTLSDDELKKIIDDAAQQSGKRYKVSSGCGEQFHQTQLRWASDTLSEWFAVEKNRGDDFVVSGVEQETTLNLNGLSLTFKIDRIDRMKNGTLALIDYKTGTPASLQNWNGARVQSPQLPLYALAQNAPVATVAYGQVRRGACALKGVSRDADFADGVHALAGSTLRHDFSNWDELIAHWRTVLSELAQEFLDGEACVQPLNPTICTSCDLHGFCRINEPSS